MSAIPFFVLDFHLSAPTWFVLSSIGGVVILILIGLRRSARKT